MSVYLCQCTCDVSERTAVSPQRSMSVQSRTSDIQNVGKLAEAESKEVCRECRCRPSRSIATHFYVLLSHELISRIDQIIT